MYIGVFSICPVYSNKRFGKRKGNMKIKMVLFTSTHVYFKAARRASAYASATLCASYILSPIIKR